jgi:hypothetical protein
MSCCAGGQAVTQCSSLDTTVMALAAHGDVCGHLSAMSWGVQSCVLLVAHQQAMHCIISHAPLNKEW